ncbi:PREDICTED: epoxide hydrolase 4 isoform X2 [Poecilia mexicana]|uniref:epoxide hydrolase 4 isoform X2 n=1 Tax=Poecilia mexicana TaxID=48701 RepID=UPI00072E79AF|nr:PREDICTED: epoxide hydrolase 4 isoform X2 [Poecilia mexicana]
MARVLNNLLLFLIRLALKIRVWGYWSLIYGYCALCTTAALLKLCWNIVLRPTTTFQWGIRETPPACLNDTSLGTHCYVRIKESGLRFHYIAAGERGKPLMLFLHGFPEFWFSWRYQLREFKSEFRVVAVDMRGYGESDLPLSTESYQLDHLVTDVKDIVEYLGYNRCCLVGHDWGGTIAWLFAIHYPEMVTKLIVLNCPHPSVFTDYALRHPSQLLKSSHFFFFQLPRFPELMLSINDFKVGLHAFQGQACVCACW